MSPFAQRKGTRSEANAGVCPDRPGFPSYGVNVRRTMKARRLTTATTRQKYKGAQQTTPTLHLEP